jgi:hypothetical protein
VFDDLDDPGPLAVPPGARAAVDSRAARLRLRRRAGWGAGAASCVAAVAVVAYAAGGGSSTSLQPADPGLPTATVSEPSPTPTATPTPSATPSPSPLVTATTAPQPATLRPTLPPASPSPGPLDYSRGSVDCTGTNPRRDSKPGRAPFPGVTLALHVPAEVTASDDADHEPAGTATLRNGGDQAVTFHYASSWRGVSGTYGPQTYAWNDAGDYSAYYGGPEYYWTAVTLAPGESTTVAVVVRTTTCASGDFYDPATGKYRTQQRPLPPGTYHVGFGLFWSTADKPSPDPDYTDGTNDWLVAPELTLRVR